ncbi:hypothetical protein C8J56DRAFT_1169107 [Mycena floridula]|nr:hypothetical protein C8J56DRAFT_1169107 [Mycena floridula]
MGFINVLRGLRRSYALSQLDLPLSDIAKFVRLAALLKRDILQPQPLPQSSPDKPPKHLPQSIACFLADALGVSREVSEHCWKVLKHDVWAAETHDKVKAADEDVFREHGWKYGLSLITLYPPHSTCISGSCDHTNPLKRKVPRQSVVYTLANGAQPAWTVQLMCPECNTMYHHNFSIQNGIRTYYSGIARYIQVGEHQFVEDLLVDLWIGSMVSGWVSASNSTSLYNTTLAGRKFQDSEGGWKFGSKVTTDHIWDAFMIKSLIEDHVRTGGILVVPHTGDQRDCFTAAMTDRNNRIEDGSYQYVEVLVCDGVSMAHPCCSNFRCTEPLQKTSHHFCPSHSSLNNICAVVGCNAPIVPKTRTCNLSEHQKMEKKYFSKGGAVRILQDRLANVSELEESLPDTEPVIAGEQWFEAEGDNVEFFANDDPGSVGVNDEEPCDGKSETGNKKTKVLFRRCQTHNEELLVRPCGVIHARATFYGAEAVSDVLIFFKKACTVPGARKLQGFIFDTNCDAMQQAEKSDDPEWYSDVAMCVDVFHFLNKHKVTHSYCQQNCNPAMYPELMTPDLKGWYFNTSIAEQTN